MFLFLSYCLFSTYFTAFVSAKNFKISVEKNIMCFILVLLLETYVLEKRIIWLDGKWDRYLCVLHYCLHNFLLLHQQCNNNFVYITGGDGLA